VLEAVADRRRRHALQPQALDRVLALAVLLDQAKDQLALAARVAGVDQLAHVLALDEPDDRVQARLVLSSGARSKCGGITGRWAKLHLPRLTSYSSGALISSRWPTAEVTT
jgi:hypothetical protein